MSTTIRLTRMGRKQRPFYRLVVVDSRKRRDSDYLDNIGIYNPMTEHYECNVDANKAIGWLEKGAVPSSTAKSLLRNEGVLYRWHLQKGGEDAATIETKVEEFRASRLSLRSNAVQKAAQDRLDKMKVEADTAAAKKAESVAAAKATAEAEVAAAAAASAEAAAAESAEEAAPEAATEAATEATTEADSAEKPEGDSE